MNIRLAVQSDLPMLTDIYNQAIIRKTCTADTEVFTVDQRQPWFDAHQNTQYPLYVCEEDGQVAGYLYFTAYRPRKAMIKTAEISYYLHQDFQGRGIGSAFMAFAIETAPSLGFHTLIAILLGINEASTGLLKKFGFEEWGRMPGIAEFDHGVSDHLYYGLKLTK